jgi:hypothetical protein
MPEWLSIVSFIIGLCGSILGIFGFTAYINERMKHKAAKRNQAEDAAEQELENMRQEQYLNSLRTVIKEENEPLLRDIAEIKQNLSLNTKGTVTILRNDMKKSLDFCKHQGFATASDKANWKELYNTYGELGGNHFKEYVDVWKKEMEELPLSKDKAKTKKKVLAE